uniref:Uncharacterized protein n=1 Tax=Setaria digitata TaxID=48799 RepID=A0A915Q895_9BILA
MLGLLGLLSLDIIGGYPNFVEEIYIYDGRSNYAPKHVRQSATPFLPLSTILRSRIKNDPNCMMKGEVGEEKNLLDALTESKNETIGSYSYGDEIRINNGELSLLRPDVSGRCTHLYKQNMKYKVNYTATCRWHFHLDKGCHVDDMIKFLSNQISGTEVCDKTGDYCEVPILRRTAVQIIEKLMAAVGQERDTAVTSNDQTCDNYTTMSVRFAVQQGSILGLLIEFLPSSDKCHEDYCFLTTAISFREITERFLDKMKMSRYENSEGRFRCPSEITCPAELLYFVNTFDAGTFSAQFVILIPLLVLLLLYIS